MAIEYLNQDVTMTAGEDLSAKQFHFVKVSADHTVVACTALTDIPFGVLQNDPVSGEGATVRIGGVSKISSDEAIAVGSLLGTSADGQAVVADPDGASEAYYVAQAISASTGAGGIVSAKVFAPVITSGS